MPLFRFDRGKVEQVLNNLISNALKFSAPGTAITHLRAAVLSPLLTTGGLAIGREF